MVIASSFVLALTASICSMSLHYSSKSSAKRSPYAFGLLLADVRRGLIISCAEAVEKRRCLDGERGNRHESALTMTFRTAQRSQSRRQSMTRRHPFSMTFHGSPDQRSPRTTAEGTGCTSFCCCSPANNPAISCRRNASVFWNSAEHTKCPLHPSGEPSPDWSGWKKHGEQAPHKTRGSRPLVHRNLDTGAANEQVGRSATQGERAPQLDG